VINSKRAVYFGREQQNLPEGMMEVDWSDVIAPLFSLISMLTVHFLPQPIPITRCGSFLRSSADLPPAVKRTSDFANWLLFNQLPFSELVQIDVMLVAHPCVVRFFSR